MEKNPHKLFYPEDLKEYGFKDGKVYETRLVKEDNVETPFFLWRIVNGDAKLFGLKTKRGMRLFGERDSLFTEFKNDASFRSKLALILIKCDTLKKNIALVKFGKSAIKRAFTLSNSCYTGFFPRVKMGLLLGYSFTNPSIKNMDGQSIGLAAPFIGGFIDSPMGSSKSWFINFQVQFQRYKYASYKNVDNHNYDFIVNTSAFTLPLLFKFSSTSQTWRTFIEMGPSYTYFIKNQNDLFDTTVSNSVIEINRSSANSISKSQLSGVIGTGIEHSFTAGKAVSLEIRYSSGTGLGPGRRAISTFQILSSIFF